MDTTIKQSNSPCGNPIVEYRRTSTLSHKAVRQQQQPKLFHTPSNMTGQEEAAGPGPGTQEEQQQQEQEQVRPVAVVSQQQLSAQHPH